MVGWSLLAFVAGLAVSVWLARVQRERVEMRHREAFVQVAEAGHAAMRSRLEQCEMLVRALQTVFLTTPGLDSRGFGIAFANLRPRERFPSLQAIAYARRDGARYVTALVAPLRGNERLLGLDVARQPANQRALEVSRDSDRPVLSAPFRLVQVADADAPVDGLVLRLPVYGSGLPPASIAERRERVVGSLAASFRVTRLIADALPPDVRRGLHIRVDDVSTGRVQPLFESHPGWRAPVASPLRFDRALEFAGRRWRVTMEPLEPRAAALDWTQSVLVPGALASVLLALLVGSLLNTRERALDLGWRMSRRYRESEKRFRALSDALPALVLLARGDGGRITYANQASRDRLGSGIDGLRLADLFVDEALRDALSRPGHPGCSNAEALLRGAGDERFWASVSIAPLELDGEGKLLMVASDVSEQRQLTELLSHQASHDALTEIYNRREFERRVEHSLAMVAAGAAPCALLFIDLDQFKLINDTSGHVAGDQLLVQLAALMRHEVRDGDVLARLGGDEFGVLTMNVQDPEGARHVAERLRERIDGHVFAWEHRTYAISASIGGVMLDNPNAGLKELFARADTACYLAKEAGRNRVHFYSEEQGDAPRRRGEMEWAQRLRWAAAEDRLELHYQEVRPLAAGADPGIRIELLLRFRGDGGRLVPPSEFLPAAERFGLMPMIDRWVVETALANFDRLHPGGGDLRLAKINLSGASIEDASFSERIIELLGEHAVEPARVCFEITETVAVRNLAAVTAFIGRLRAAGCLIALDDFGAGMSSFGYLKNLPVDIIKIDGGFVRDYLADPMSRAIVRAVTDIGHERGLKVVAEWVDSPELAEALAVIGIDYAQGFGLHRPQTVPFQCPA